MGTSTRTNWRLLALIAIVATAWLLALTLVGCYTGNPDIGYDPTQPPGPFPRRYYQAPGDGGMVDAGLPPLPETAPRHTVWCDR